MTTDEIVAFKGEVWLLSWKESHNNGATVTFQLADSDELAPFKAMTVKKGKRAGQRLMCVLVEIGDDEQPVRQEKKGGPLSKSAALACEYQVFHAFLKERYADYWNVWDRELDDEDIAAKVVRAICQVESRADLDHDQDGGKRFHELMREYREWNAGGQRNQAV